MLSREFRQQGIEPIFDRFYLDCNKLNEKDEIEHVRKYLELLENKSTDLILTIGDQSVYALLSTHHRLLSSVPVVACNVRFPNDRRI